MIQLANHNGHALTLILDKPDWTRPPQLTVRLDAAVVTGRTGIENRRPLHHALRHELRLTYTLDPADALAWQTRLSASMAGYIALPLPFDRLRVDHWRTGAIPRIYEARQVIVTESSGLASIHAAADITNGFLQNLAAVDPDATLAPLFAGRLKSRPILKALTNRHAQADLTLLEESPWAYRLAPATFTPPPGLDWPASLAANWSAAPEDSTTDTLDFTPIGNARLKAIDGQEGAITRSQKFTLTLGSREEINTFLRFVSDRKGPVETFTIPWLLRPSENPTEEVPHTTRVRFADTSLTLSWLQNPDAAETRLQVRQVPDAPVGIIPAEAPALPAEAFLYTFTLAIPGIEQTLAWRYTDWENSITYQGATWLGDKAGLIQHDQITLTNDLSDSPANITLSATLPGNPLALIAAGALDYPVRIDIASCVPHTAGDATTTNSMTDLYSGSVDKVTANGRTLKASTRVLGGLLENKVPRFVFSDTCNHRFCVGACSTPGGPTAAQWTCGAVIKNANGSSLTLKSISNPNTIPLSAHFLARGVLMASTTGIDWEIRQIIDNTAVNGSEITLTLRSPLRDATPDRAITFRPDCDGTMAACQARGNFDNFGGHPHIGAENLSLPAYEQAINAKKK
jgi:hypothetical protein